MVKDYRTCFDAKLCLHESRNWDLRNSEGKRDALATERAILRGKLVWTVWWALVVRGLLILAGSLLLAGVVSSAIVAILWAVQEHLNVADIAAYSAAVAGGVLAICGIFVQKCLRWRKTESERLIEQCVLVRDFAIRNVPKSNLVKSTDTLCSCGSARTYAMNHWRSLFRFNRVVTVSRCCPEDWKAKMRISSTCPSFRTRAPYGF